MNLRDITAVVNAHMERYQLFQEGWSVGPWLRSVYVLGQTNYYTKSLVFSSVLLPLQPEWIVRDTILHEIAHVQAGPDAAHGPQWQACAVSLGAMPHATNPFAIDAPSPFTLVCVNCWVSIPRHRKTSKIHMHCDEPMEWIEES
jgi:hypothetical protein